MNIEIKGGECPCAQKLKQIEQIVADFKIHESVDVVEAVDILAAELTMRRAKELYEIKLKASIVGYAKEYFDGNENKE
jgi:hypothetical protein